MVWADYGPWGFVDPVTVSRFNGSGFDHYHRPRILPRGLGQGLAVDHDDQIWFGLGMPGGVGMYDDETWTVFDNLNSGLEPTCYTKIAVDVAGHVWFAGGSGCLGGLVEYDGLDWTQHSGAGGVPDLGVQALAVDEDNRFWAGTEEGLSVYDGVNWYTYTEDNSGLPNNNVGSIAVDGDENIWVGCTTRFDFVDGTWGEPFASPEAAIEAHYDDLVESVYNDFACWVADEARGLVWRGNSILGVKAYDGVSWQSFSDATMDLAHPYSWRAWPMGLDGAGNVWVVASDSHPRYGGVSRFDGANWTGYRQADGLLEPPNFAMAAEGDNHVWFANGSGLSEFYNPWLPVHTTVTPVSGGELTSADGSTLVVFPAGAVSQDTTVTLTPLLPMPTGTLVGIDHFFDLTAAPSGGSGAAPAAAFDPPYSLTVTYRPDELGLAMKTTLAINGGTGHTGTSNPAAVWSSRPTRSRRRPTT
ncbi:two-component regulator propeller domain-containing protein [Chloroflexota bacterium]